MEFDAMINDKLQRSAYRPASEPQFILGRPVGHAANDNSGPNLSRRGSVLARVRRRRAAGSPTVLIYRPATSPVQSGRAGERRWLLEFAPQFASEIEPLMGWTSSCDVRQQVRIAFSTSEDAIAFAERQGWRPIVLPAHDRRVRLKSYAENFRPPRRGPSGSARPATC